MTRSILLRGLWRSCKVAVLCYLGNVLLSWLVARQLWFVIAAIGVALLVVICVAFEYDAQRNEKRSR